jgi:hypothetical protein
MIKKITHKVSKRKSRRKSRRKSKQSLKRRSRRVSKRKSRRRKSRNNKYTIEGGASNAQMGEALKWRGKFMGDRRAGNQKVQGTANTGLQNDVRNMILVAAKQELQARGAQLRGNESRAEVKNMLGELIGHRTFVDSALSTFSRGTKFSRTQAMNGIAHSGDNTVEGRILKRVFGEPGSYSFIAQQILEETRITNTGSNRSRRRARTDTQIRNLADDNDVYQQRCIELFNIMRKARIRQDGYRRRLSLDEFLTRPEIRNVLFGTVGRQDGLLTDDRNPMEDDGDAGGGGAEDDEGAREYDELFPALR